MATLTIRLPDEKHERLRQLAERRNVSMNKLIEELSTVALAEFDAETRFRARAALGSREQGLRLLDELDRSE
ncbi:MAG TPA: ribbon-helix-helix protein, CopG family [Thermoanaerobaculia bacterium]|jgi:predicted transcriptional regulator|nr:ribbon-helix-helix protein, CopG family [Thermoanaerobaculia bacterium]